MSLKILNKPSFGAGPRLPMDRCGKTNCSNTSRSDCVGSACPRRLPAIQVLQKIGFYPIRGQRLKIQLRGGFQTNLAAQTNPQPVARETILPRRSVQPQPCPERRVAQTE